jgi:hypothetical protein
MGVHYKDYENEAKSFTLDKNCFFCWSNDSGSSEIQ